MSPITHFLVGWVGLERTQATHRDRMRVVLAGLMPDLDGLGIVVDFCTRLAGVAPTDYYQAWHRLYGHGLPAALVIAACATWGATRRRTVALAAFASVHLHLLCDLAGSRGSTVDDLWGIWYFAPFSTALEWRWSGQWPLVGWVNTSITAVLIAMTLWRAAIHGYSPLALVHGGADAELVRTVRRWRGLPAGTTAGR